MIPPSMENIVKNALYISLFATLFTPLLYTESLIFPAVTGKAIYFYVLVQISLLLYTCHLYIEKKPKLPQLSWVTISLLAFLVTLGLSTVTSDNPQVSFFGNFERMEGYITLLHLGIYFILLTSLLTSQKIWDRFFLTTTVISVVVSLTALAQYFTIVSDNAAEARVDILFGNATLLGAYAMLHTFIAGYLAAKQRGFSMMQIGLATVATLNFTTIILSGTRAALLGLLGGAIAAVTIYFLRTKRISLFQKISIASILVIIAVASVGTAYLYRESLKNTPMIGRLLYLSPETITEQPRYFIWKAATQGFLDKPLLGWGPNTFITVYSQYYSPETKNRFNVAIGETWIDKVHNIYLEWLVTGGIGTFLFYLLLLGTTIHTFIFNTTIRDAEQAWIMGLLFAYFINNLFAFDSISSYILFFAILAYTHFVSKKIIFPLQKIYIPSSAKAATGVLLLVTTIYFFNISTVRSYTTAATVAAFLKSEDGSNTQLQLFEKLTDSKMFAPWHINALLAEDIRSLVKTQAGKTSVTESLVTAMRKRIESDARTAYPDARTLFIYCRAMREIAAPQDALNICTQAATQAPNTQEVLIELGQLYRDLKRYGDSLRIIEKAFTSEPEYDLVRPEYAAALIYSGKQKQAVRTLEERYGNRWVDNESLLGAYIYNKSFSDALKIIEKHIQHNPREIGYYLSQASIYLKMDKKDEAISAIKNMMKIDNRLKKTGEQIIRKIEADEAVLGDQVSF